MDITPVSTRLPHHTSTKTVYAVIDLETTGGMSRRDKITEVAIVLFDGEKIIEQFETLINPERSIPFEITRITGITDDMVAEAPKFYEVAKKIVEMTENAIFVAHNARFDYSFIREEFASLGYTYTRKTLCTVALSRKSFPGLTSYSLGNLIRHFDIQVRNRHRAMDDALATVDVLQRALNLQEGKFRTQSFIKEGLKATQLPQNISPEFIQSLPDAVGVYYFLNAYDTIIYVGKSINIRKRVMQHFGKTDGKSDKFIQKVAQIKYTLTGSDLAAMLLESHEIKILSPEINKAQRTKEFPYFIYQYEDLHGYIRFSWEKSNNKNIRNKNILNYYSSRQSARSQLHQITEIFSLCGCLTGLNDTQTACFDFQTGHCSKVIFKDEDYVAYNQRAADATKAIQTTFENDFYIVTNGRTQDEKTVVMISEGQYKGFGYIPSDKALDPSSDWKNHIQPQLFTPETHQIIRTWLDKNTDYEIIPV